MFLIFRLACVFSISVFNFALLMVEKELPTLPEHLSSPPVLCGVHVTRSLVFSVCFVDRCLFFCTFFLFAIVLAVLRRSTDSDYPFGVFKLFI